MCLEQQSLLGLDEKPECTGRLIRLRTIGRADTRDRRITLHGQTSCLVVGRR